MRKSSSALRGLLTKIVILYGKHLDRAIRSFATVATRAHTTEASGGRDMQLDGLPLERKKLKPKKMFTSTHAIDDDAHQTAVHAATHGTRNAQNISKHMKNALLTNV